jgi:glycerol-3-phosphate dehydrogenase
MRDLAAHRPDLAEPVVEGLPYTGAELVYAAREEMVCTLDDLLSRRTRATIQRAGAAMRAAASAAALVAGELAWDRGTVEDQVSRYTTACRDELVTAGLDAP